LLRSGAAIRKMYGENAPQRGWTEGADRSQMPGRTCNITGCSAS